MLFYVDFPYRRMPYCGPSVCVRVTFIYVQESENQGMPLLSTAALPAIRVHAFVSPFLTIPLKLLSTSTFLLFHRLPMRRTSKSPLLRRIDRPHWIDRSYRLDRRCLKVKSETNQPTVTMHTEKRRKMRENREVLYFLDGCRRGA